MVKDPAGGTMNEVIGVVRRREGKQKYQHQYRDITGELSSVERTVKVFSCEVETCTAPLRNRGKIEGWRWGKQVSGGSGA